MTLKAPNGNTSNLTPEQYAVVRTNAFKEWFGDWEKLAMAKVKDPAMDEVTLANLSKDVSKVVDENGEPLVVYHSTNSDFTIFNERFAFFAKDVLPFGDKVMSCFLNIKKPYTLSDADSWSNINISKRDERWEELYNDLQNEDGIVIEDICVWAKEKKYDGVIAKNIGETELTNIITDDYIAFYSNQIKLADGSNTTFNGSNPDIRFNNGGNVKTDFNDYENSAFRKAIVSFWNDFTNSEISNYLDIGKEDYVIDNERGVLVITRSNRSSIFSNVEKQKFQNWIAPYLDTKRKKDIANYFLDYSIVDNTIIIKLSLNEMYKNGGKMKSVSNGTITIGASHDNGGIPVYNKGTGQMLEVEGGEGIINKRSMALKKEVTLNGDKMTPCEAASEINQMAGGVEYNCDNVVDSKEMYDGGGEFKKGLQAEQEHQNTLNKLYEQDITPNEAMDDIVEEHLSEDDKYYSKLRGIIEEPQRTKTIKDFLLEIEPYRHKHECWCETNKFNNGGGVEKDLSDIELPKNLDDYDILGEKGIYEKKPTIELSEQDKINAQKLGNAIKKMQELINTDYKPIILADEENKKLHRYVEKFRHLNLYKLGWRANVGVSKAWAGICMAGGMQKQREILLSYNFIVGDDAFDENLEDTMLHEIAHAIVAEVFILNTFELPLDKLKPSRVQDLSLYKQPLDIIDQTHSESGGHGIMWAAVCEAISKGFICDMFYRLAQRNELMRDYKYKCIRCNNEEYGFSRNFANKCSKCGTPVLVIKNKL